MVRWQEDLKMLNTTSISEPVVIAVDPHKASWTAAAVDRSLTSLATITVPVSPQGYRRLRQFAGRWSSVMWAIEGAAGPGAPLTTRLSGDGIAAVDVPAKLAARVRVLSAGHGRKNDVADAVSVGVAALTASGLRSAAVEETIVALRALVEHRDDVVRSRTQTINRLHVLLTQLLPGGAPRRLTADTAAALLRGVRPRANGARTLRRLAVELVAEVRHLDRRIAARDDDIAAAVADSGCTLVELRGVGALLAGKILARVGDVRRFRSTAAFAAFNGTAPIEASSGQVMRHRLSRAGDRQLNSCLHIMAISQLRRECLGRRYYLRKRAEGKGHMEALRCLKRRLSDLVYRQLVIDASRNRGTSPGGHQGATP
jgi:transposase